MTAPIDRDRLAKLLGLLGSDHPREVVAAAWQAERIRREAGTTWYEIIGARGEGGDAHQTVRWCREHEHLLTAREQAFLASLAGLRTLSPRQIEIVEQIAAKVRRAEARAA